MRTPTRRLLAVTVLAATGVAACNDDGSTAAPPEPAVADLQEWCDLIRSVDRRFEIVDTTPAGTFAEQRTTYAELNALLGDLQASTDLVPAGDRAAVASTIDWAIEITGALADAADAAEAEAEVGPLFEARAAADLAPAAAWIKQECGVTIDG